MNRSELNRRTFLQNSIVSVCGFSMMAAIPKIGAGAQGSNNAGNKLDLRFRQILLDFHTSGEIRGVGEKFDPDEWLVLIV